MNIKFVDNIPKNKHYQTYNDVVCWSNSEDSILFSFKGRGFNCPITDFYIDYICWYIHFGTIHGLIDKVLLGENFEESKKKWIENGWIKETAKDKTMVWNMPLIMAMCIGDYKYLIFKERFEYRMF